MIDNYFTIKYFRINISVTSKYVVEEVSGNTLLRESDIANDLTTSSVTRPLSAAQGKKLNDEKLPKSFVVNNLTTTDTSKALSAAQGKALNDKISALGSVYRIKGTKANISEVLALTDAKVGDAWNVTNAFTFGGKPYPANTNIVCITATSSSDHDEGNWDPIGGTVDLSPYAKKTELEESADEIWEQLGVVVAKDEIVNNLTSSETNKPLSAAMGKKLQDEKLSKTDASNTYATKNDMSSTASALDNKKLDKTDVVDNLTTSSKGKALDASQGVILKEAINTKINAYLLPGTIVFDTDEPVIGDDNGSVAVILGDVGSLRSAIAKGTVIQGIVSQGGTNISVPFCARDKANTYQVELYGLINTNKSVTIIATYTGVNWDEARGYLYTINSGITIE